MGTVGEPTPCCEVKLSDSGEILTRGPAHMQGYYKAPDLTAEAVDAEGKPLAGPYGGDKAMGRVTVDPGFPKDLVPYMTKHAEVLLQEKKISAMPDWKKALRTEYMEKARKA